MSEQFKPFQRVLVRDEIHKPWRAAFFGFYKVKVWDKYKGGVEKDALFICKRRNRYVVLLPDEQIALFTACRSAPCS